MSVTLSKKTLTLKHSSGPTVEVDLFGATVTSWVVDDTERIFVSKLAKRDGSKAIRGGIPICFPIFGTKESIQLPQHGFARNTYWEYIGSEESQDDIIVRLGLNESALSDKAKEAWPYSFNAVYTVTLTDTTLGTSLIVENTDDENIDFNVLFHTYFKTTDVESCSIEGLTSLDYIDKVEGVQNKEIREHVTIKSEVDRIYTDVQGDIILNNVGYSIQLNRSNLRDIVVWNPWIEKAIGMNDFDNKEYRNMICVEAGSVVDWVTLASGEVWTGGQILTLQ
ncbi:galactose mutarotase-like domain-containing protein [Pilobolus umbonatus]|nr:galactose mutarotase-like domain-containing protein [Pilobolus umbonatus]